MSGNVEKWIEQVERQGAVCAKYMRRLRAASDKSELFRVLCDVNGGAWVFEIHAKGVRMPIDDFVKEYERYIDGHTRVVYEDGYSSQMHVRRTGDTVEADTTLVYLLECEDVSVGVPPFTYPTVILSHGSHANLKVGDGACVNVELYGDATYTASGDTSHVKVERK
jgi:hypothetical protein